MPNNKHIQALLATALVAFVVAQWRRVSEWYQSLLFVQKFAWAVFALVLALGIVARQFGTQTMIGLALTLCAALVLRVAWLAYRVARKL